MPLLHELPRIVKKRKRIGRGVGSGHGGTSTRGTKGQKARAGFSRKAGFEGGQTPLYMRLPKGRGSKQRSLVRTGTYTAVTIRQIAALIGRIPGRIIGPGQLRTGGYLGTTRERVKLIGVGEVRDAVTVRVHAVSAAARQAIEFRGGKVEII